MLFHFKVCLERTDNNYFTCPLDFKVNSKWEEITKTAKKYNGHIVQDFYIVFNDEQNLKLFMHYFIHLYAGIPL